MRLFGLTPTPSAWARTPLALRLNQTSQMSVLSESILGDDGELESVGDAEPESKFASCSDSGLDGVCPSARCDR